jgi:hypothetical protein
MLRSGPPFALKDRLLKSGPELQNAHHAVGTRRVSATRLRLPQGELSRKTNQVARARIRRIAVGTLITVRPPHRTERAPFGHSAPTSGI